MSEERLRASTGSLCFPGRTAVDSSAVRRPTDAVGGRHGLGTKAKPLGACSIATAALLSELPNRTEMDSCTVGHSRRGGPSAPFVPLAVSPSWHEATTKPRPVPVGAFLFAPAQIFVRSSELGRSRFPWIIAEPPLPESDFPHN